MQSVSKLKNVNQHTSCPTSPEDAFTIRHVRWRNVFVDAGAAPLVPRTISRPCPPAQPSPLCRLLFLQQCPLYEPAYRLSGLPPGASSHSEPGPPVSWRTNARRRKIWAGGHDGRPLQSHEIICIFTFHRAAARWMLHANGLVFTEAWVRCAPGNNRSLW